MKKYIIVLAALAVSCLVPELSWAVKVGGTFTTMINADPSSLHPINSTDAYATSIQSYIFDSLLTHNLDTYEFQPALAEKFEGSKDGMEYIFTLRDGVKFHDGTPVTVEDVKFSFDVIWDSRFNTAHKRPYFENIESPQIIDAKHIKFKFKKKYFLNLEQVASTAILPKHIYDSADKKLNKVLIGSGPYTFESYERANRIVLKRNSNWWGFSAPQYKDHWNFEKIVIRVVPEESVAMEMLKKGDLDELTLTAEQYQLKAQGPEWGKKLLKVKTENKEPKTYGFVGWNLKHAMFADKNVRIALSHLVNRELMNQKFRFNMSLLMSGPVYPLSDNHSPNIKPISFDPKKGLELLMQAGWKDEDKNGILEKTIDGKKVEFSFTILNPNQDFNKYLTVYKEDAKKVGVDIQIKNIEWNSFIKILDEGSFDAVVLAWAGGSPEWEGKQIWHSSSATKGGSNFIGYSNPEVDKLIDQNREELDAKKRIPIVRKIDELIASDAPYTFLFAPKYVLYAHNARIKKPKDTFKYAVGAETWWVE